MSKKGAVKDSTPSLDTVDRRHIMEPTAGLEELYRSMVTSRDYSNHSP